MDTFRLQLYEGVYFAMLISLQRKVAFCCVRVGLHDQFRNRFASHF